MPKPKVCNGAGVPVAYSWVATPNGTIARYLVRYCHTCKQSHVSQLRYVDPDYMVCPACLGQRVESATVAGWNRIHCLECGQRSAFPDEDEDEDQDDA